MKVSSSLNLYAVHKSSKSTEGRVRVPTRDAWFDERFTVRTDSPNDALAFLADEKALGELKKLCCSPGTSVALTKESLELSELTVPLPDTLKHLIAHLDSLAVMAVQVGAIAKPAQGASQDLRAGPLHRGARRLGVARHRGSARTLFCGASLLERSGGSFLYDRRICGDRPA
jgi:hypothetical protein